MNFKSNQKQHFLSDEALFASPCGDDAVWELLSLYTDGEASADEAAQVEALLRFDAALAQEFAFLKNASQIAQSVPDVMPPDHLRDAIFAATLHRPTLTQRITAAFAPAALRRYAAPVGRLAAAAVLGAAFWPRSIMHSPAVAKRSLPVVVAKNNLPATQVSPDAPIAAMNENPAISTAKHPAVAPTPVSAAKGTPQNASVTPEKNTAKVPTIQASVRKTNKIKNVNASGRAIKTTQSPTVIARNETSTVVRPEYSPQPGMDNSNMKPVVVANAAVDTDRLPDSEHSVSETRTGEVAGPPAPATPKRWVGKLLHPAPDARQFVTTASLRQQRQAYNQGYTELTVKGIEQHQIVAGFGGRF